MQNYAHNLSDMHNPSTHHPFTAYREHPSLHETSNSGTRSWTSDEVKHRLTQAGSVHRNDIDLLRREDIDGAALISLSHAHLQHIGVSTFGRRNGILQTIKALANSHKAHGETAQNARHFTNTTLFPSQTQHKLPTRWQQLGFDRCTLHTAGEVFGNNLTTTTTCHDDHISGRIIEPSLSARASLTADLSLRANWQNLSLKQMSQSSRYSNSHAILHKHTANSYAHSPNTHAPANGTKQTAFEHRVELEWIYGMRQYSPNNLSCQQVLFNANGAIIYTIDHCAVVLSSNTAQSHFTAHTRPITAMCQHPIDLNLIVTASAKENDQSESVLYVWDSTHHQTMICVSGVADTVTSLAFNGNGSLLGILCSDQQHKLYLYEWTTSTWLTAVPLTSHDATQIRFNHRMLAEFVTIGNGHIGLHTFDYANRSITTLTTPQLVLPSQTVPHFTAVTYNCHGYVCAGTNDGELYVFTSTQLLHYMTLHNAPLTCLDWHPDGIVTAGADGCLHRIDDTFTVTSSLTLNGDNDWQNNGDSDVAITAVQLYCRRLCITTSRGEMLTCDDWSDDTNNIGYLQSVMATEYGHCFIDASSHRDVLFISNEQSALIQLDLNKHSVLSRSVLGAQLTAETPHKHYRQPIRRVSSGSVAISRISPCDSFAVIGCGETLFVYDLQEMTCVVSLPLRQSHTSPLQQDVVSAVVFAPQSAIIAVGTRSGHIILCTYSREQKQTAEYEDDNVDDAVPVKLTVVIRRVLTGHNSAIRQIQWSADEKHVVSADEHDCLQYWNIDIASVDRSVPMAHINVNETQHNQSSISWAKHNIHSLEFINRLLPITSSSIRITAIQTERSLSPKLIAIGFSNGVIRLYMFPLDHRSQHTLYYSTTSMTTSLVTSSYVQVIIGSHAIKQIEWSYNNKRLFITMENTANIFQYKIV